MNLNKCSFMTKKLLFLGFIVHGDAIQVDEEKVKVIRDWPTPRILTEVKSFHELAIFYRQILEIYKYNCADYEVLKEREIPLG